MNLIVQIVVPFALLVFLNIKIFHRVKQLEARIARNSFGFAHSLTKEKDERAPQGCLECGRSLIGAREGMISNWGLFHKNQIDLKFILRVILKIVLKFHTLLGELSSLHKIQSQDSLQRKFFPSAE